MIIRYLKLSCSCLTASLLLAGCDNPKTEREPAGQASTQMAFDEREVSTGQLFGTYLNAEKNAPIVVIVPGSGPTDKDGNNGGLTSNTLKFVAQGLAEQGISSIRVDKRGLFSSANAGDANAVSVEIYAEDYRAWASTAIELSGQNCAYLFGHSEGGLMVSAAAVGQDNICGIITLAAPGRRLSDVLREQLKRNPANKPILKQAEMALQSLEKGERVDVSELHPALNQLFYPAVQDFLISTFAVDPAELLASVNLPTLVLQGEHDLQVSVKDAERLASISGAKLVLVPGVNHVLKPAPMSPRANFKAYNSPNVPADPMVTQEIGDFIRLTEQGR